MKSTIKYFIVISFVLLVLLPYQKIFAQWSTDPNINNAICTTAENQRSPIIASDGKGGAIMVWKDARDGAVYVQRINEEGTVKWTKDGVAVSNIAPGSLIGIPDIVSDGAGGAIVTWSDEHWTRKTVFAQHIGASGEIKWTAGGLVIGINPFRNTDPAITSDGAGGAIIAWENMIESNDIYAKHVDADGAIQWEATVSATTGNQDSPTIISDGSGGAIVAWKDYRNNANCNIYAQHVNAAGNVQWTTDGVAICTASGIQESQTIVSDGSGGAIITWKDYRDGGSNFSIYTQRISGEGTILWPNNGVAITTSGYNYSPIVESDGAGGAIIAWQDLRGIYAQRIDAGGTVKWTNNGVAVGYPGANPAITSDRKGGAIISWTYDHVGSNYDIYAQRISTDGTIKWASDGVRICTAPGSQSNSAIISDGTGGAIITWEDYRSGSNYDIYAQKVNRYGVLGDSFHIHSVKDVPNDQGGKVIVLWDHSPFDIIPQDTVTSYTIYRGLKESILLKKTNLNRNMKIIKSSINGETIYWENYITVPASWLSGYSCAVETLSDSTAKGNPMYYFMVTANTSDPLVFWESPIDSCYSVDNLPPSSPVQPKIVSSPEGKIQLCWNKNNVDPDVDGYTVYRSESTGFALTNENKLAYIKDTVYIDILASTGQNYYYRIITEDTHGNRSMPSTELSVNSASSLVNSALPITTELLQNYPNPFNPSTSIKYQVSSIEFVSLKVYDMLGRVVKILANEMKNPGVYEVKWNAVNMPSGIYCCRLQAGSYSESKKLILLK